MRGGWKLARAMLLLALPSPAAAQTGAATIRPGYLRSFTA